MSGIQNNVKMLILVNWSLGHFARIAPMVCTTYRSLDSYLHFVFFYYR